MTVLSIPRYIARETGLGLMINVVVSTVPSSLTSHPSSVALVRTVREVAVGLTPQFFMVALMSALAPSLLVCFKRNKGVFASAPFRSRLRPTRAAVNAVALATASTVLVLASIHLFIAPVAAGGMTSAGVLALRGAQAAFAALTVTPLALILLIGRAWRCDGEGRTRSRLERPGAARSGLSQ